MGKRREVQEELALPESIGFRLKQLREEQGLAIEDIADQLCLSGSVIEAIEKDDYMGEKNTVFVRGHIRSYAKLMGVSEKEVQLSMVAMGLIKPSEPIKPVKFDIDQVGTKDKRLRWVSYLIVFIFFLLVFLWKYVG